jgi:hypothetical protein
LPDEKKNLPDGWTLHAYPDKDTVICGERFEVTVMLLNETQDTISLHWHDPLNPLVDMYFIDPDQPHILPYSISCGESYPRIIHVAPNSSYSEIHSWRERCKDKDHTNKVYAIVPYLRGDKYYTGIGDPVAVTIVGR